jgi:hypothetical protein
LACPGFRIGKASSTFRLRFTGSPARGGTWKNGGGITAVHMLVTNAFKKMRPFRSETDTLEA